MTRAAKRPAVIVDPHMHVGEFPLFDVALDEQGLVALFEEFDYEAGIVFHPDNALTRGIVERVPNAWALVLGQPARCPATPRRRPSSSIIRSSSA